VRQTGRRTGSGVAQVLAGELGTGEAGASGNEELAHPSGHDTPHRRMDRPGHVGVLGVVSVGRKPGVGSRPPEVSRSGSCQFAGNPRVHPHAKDVTPFS